MNPNDMLDKTPKGQEEIQSRKHKLPAKLRMLLLLVDGRLQAAELIEQSIKLGVPESGLAELLALGFIAPVEAPTSAAPSPPRPAAPAPTPAAPAPAPAAAPAPAPAAAVPAPDTAADKFERYREARDLMNDSIVRALGLKSYVFTTQIEKTATLNDLRGLFDDYQRIITKALGVKSAKPLVARLKAMLEP